MNRLLYILFLTVVILVPQRLGAQSFPMFSQYVSNGLVLNPAYSGSREVLSISFMQRNQWVGFKGAPVYQTLSAHAPLKNDNVGVGFLFLNEKSGPLQNTHAYLNYAYRIRVGDDSRLALGLKAGINYTTVDWRKVYTGSANDPTFADAESFVLPNFGFGLYYYNTSFFAGASVPYILSYESKKSGGYQIYHEFKNYNYLITAGYLFDIATNFKLKPTTLIKYNTQYSSQLDLNLNMILFKDHLWLGAAYRTKEAIAYIIEVQVNPQFKIGYSFDKSNSDIEYFKYNSHEFSLRYEFSYKIKASNPRYF